MNSEKNRIGKKIIWYDKVQSTNTLYDYLITENLFENGIVIAANYQLQGKGQRGKKWESEDSKNLMFSIYLKPANITVMSQFMLNKLISIGIINFFNDYLQLPNTKIKWPNDIFINNKKIAGILIENSISGNYLNLSIIGIGLNVNQKKFDNILNATSIALETNKEYERKMLLENLLYYIDNSFQTIFSNSYTKIEKTFINNLYKLNESQLFEINNKNETGIIKGVNEIGQLLLSINNETNTYNNQEIQWVF